MKKVLVLILVLFSFQSIAQNNGFGFRLGDLSGLTYKKYMGSKALEISLGRTHVFYGNHWYNERFEGWYKDKKYYYDDMHYIAFDKGVGALGLQVHYLFQKPINGTSSSTGSLDWYFGIGGQINFHSYRYVYEYKVNGLWYQSRDRVTNIDLGADGVIGLEYKFSQPFSIFIDATLFMEIFDDLFLPWGQGGIGARYNF